MAFPTSDSGYFTITALSFSPSVIAVGESVSFSITLKNTSGKSVTSCYITLSGTYPSTNASSGTGYVSDVYLHGGPSFAMSSISWGSNVSKTFTGTFPFLPGYYAVDGSNVHIVTAYSATLTIGYSYNTAWSDRKTLLKSKTGIVMGTKTGSKAIDLTEVIQAYCRDGQSGTLRLWAFGTGGSTSLSRIRGYNPSSSYQSQRPYFTLTYDDSKARIFMGGEWKSAVPYVYHNGAWTAVNIQAFSDGGWK